MSSIKGGEHASKKLIAVTTTTTTTTTTTASQGLVAAAPVQLKSAGIAEGEAPLKSSHLILPHLILFHLI